MGGATGRCGGTMPPPHFWDQRGAGGTGGGGPVKMIFASTADNLYSVLYKRLNFNSPDYSRHLPS